MRKGTHKGTIDCNFTVENDLGPISAGGVTATIELTGSCEYYFTPGCPATGPTYDCGGTPEEPPEVEYFNFKGIRLEITLWNEGRHGKDGPTYRQNISHSKVEADAIHADLWGNWLEEIVAENHDGFRDGLDEKVGEILYELSLPPDRDDEDD